MQIKLPDEIQTEQALQALLAALRTKTPDEVQADMLKLFWQSNPKLSTDHTHRQTLTEQVGRIVENSEKATVSFAQPPDTEFLIELTGWLRTQVKPYLVLDVQIDPMLVGGMVLRTNEHIYDWSLRLKLTESKAKLTELLYAS